MATCRAPGACRGGGSFLGGGGGRARPNWAGRWRWGGRLRGRRLQRGGVLLLLIAAVRRGDDLVSGGEERPGRAVQEPRDDLDLGEAGGVGDHDRQNAVFDGEAQNLVGARERDRNPVHEFLRS